jgi:methylmalonyl-CoA mutase
VEEAWKVFLKVEELGGFVGAWKAEFIQKEVAGVRGARLKAVSQRRRSIVGTSNYPNLKESHDLRYMATKPTAAATPTFSGAGRLVDLVGMMREGAALHNWVAGSHEPELQPVRLAEPFEEVRLAVEQYVAKGNKRPVIFLAQLGDRTMRKARAGFVTGFFGAGGYAIEEGMFENAADAAKAAKEAGAKVVILCGADADYPTYTASLKAALGGAAKLVIAGYPIDAIDQLKADGADDFIHIKLNVVDTLKRYNKELGVTL